MTAATRNDRFTPFGNPSTTNEAVVEPVFGVMVFHVMPLSEL